MSFLLLNLANSDMCMHSLTPFPLLCGHLLTLEKSHDAIAHWKLFFWNLRYTLFCETGNGSAYILQKTWQVFCVWGMSHSFGIPFSNSSRQCWMHSWNFKACCKNEKGGIQEEILHSRLGKALNAINHIIMPVNSIILSFQIIPLCCNLQARGTWYRI